MAEACKQLGETVLTLLESLRNRNDNHDLAVNSSLEKLKLVSSLAETINGSLRGETAETLADMLDDEMLAMDKAIEEAAKRIQVRHKVLKTIIKVYCEFIRFYFAYCASVQILL